MTASSPADRGLPVVLAATAVLTFLDHAAKDAFPDRGRRAAVTAVTQLAMAGISLLDVRANPVNPYAVASGPQAGLAARIGAVGLGWYAAERLAVHMLRRSRLRRPNTAAGLLLAVSRPAGTVAVMRMLPRAADDA